MDFADWWYGKPPCHVCKHFNRRKGIDDPCAENLCEAPAILPENEEVVAIWSEVNGMLKYGATGPVSLDVPAIKIYLDLNGVENQAMVLKKLVIISSVIIDRANKDRSNV